jgi:hypothetical protein
MIRLSLIVALFAICGRAEVISVNGTGTPKRISFATMQAAIDAACLGDTIQMEAGVPLDLANQQYLQVRKASCGTSGYVTITTSTPEKLPRDGTRITPAYLPVMGIIRKDPTAGPSDDNNPWLFIHGGGKWGADHVKVKGIAFVLKPFAERANYNNIPNRNMGQAVVSIGKQQGGWYGDGSVGPAAGLALYPNETTLVGGAGAGATELTLADASWVQPGMMLGLLDLTSSQAGNSVPGNTYINEWLPVSAVNGNTITISKPGGLLYNHTAAAHRIVQWVSRFEDMPDDIVLEHCIILGDHFTLINYGIRPETRGFTLKDSFVDGIMKPSGDSRGVIIHTGVGPYTFENNYISGSSMPLMFSGGTPAGDWEAGANGPVLVQYNYFPHILERRRFGSWDIVASKAGQFGIPGLILPGRHVFATPNYGANFWEALNPGIAGTKPPFPTSVPIGTTFTHEGITWVYVANTHPMVKNNFEIKNGQNITVRYNVMDGYPDNSQWNQSQFAAVNIKTETQGFTPSTITGKAGCTNSGNNQFPYCYAARTKNILFANNKVLTQAGGLNIGGSGGGWIANESRDWTIRDNLVIQTEIPMTPFYKSMIRIQAASANHPNENLQILHNTFYAPHRTAWFGADISVSQSTGANFPGDARFVGNIWPRWIGGLHHDSTGNDGGNALKYFPCQGQPAANCTTRQWDRNVIVGSPTAPNNYRFGSVLSNCPTSSACLEDWTFSGAQPNGETYASLFRDASSGLFEIQNDHQWAKRAVDDGSDIGADTSQVPDIRQLTAIPTDRLVMFHWTVTPAIAEIPCVVEVWKDSYDQPPFFGTYAGELSDMSTYYRQDADDADRNVRHGLDRMVAVGHSIPLTPSTQYFYRLQCGGDAKHGTFTTMGQMEGIGDQTVARVAEHRDVSSMEVEYGTSYSRATDSIGDRGTASAQCQQGQTCSVTFPATRGTLIYFRWTERDSSGLPLQWSGVGTLIAQ